MPDLGIDLVLVHALDADKATIEPKSGGVVPPGSGPRHIAFTADGGRAYVINELALTVTGFDFDAEEGTLIPFQTVSTIPEEITDREGFSTAELVIHPSGRFLYGSNRGHHSIAMFEVDQDNGQLTLLGVEPIRGKTPRNFNISPDGRWLLAAGQDSDTVTVFAIDGENGAARVHRADCQRAEAGLYLLRPLADCETRLPPQDARMAVSTDSSRSGSGFQFGHQVFGLCDLAELLQSLGLDLPHPLLGHAQSRAHLLERLRLVLVVEPVAADDDRLLAGVEPIEEPAPPAAADRWRPAAAGTRPRGGRPPPAAAPCRPPETDPAACARRESCGRSSS